MRFTATAWTTDGIQVIEPVEAEDSRAAGETLRSRGLMVSDGDIVPAKGATWLERSFYFRRGAQRNRDLAKFGAGLGGMLRDNLPLTAALRSLSTQYRGTTLKNAVIDLRNRVEGGQSLSQAMIANEEDFGEIFPRMVAAGEESGNIDDSLITAGKMFQFTVNLQREIKTAMTYPIVVGGLAFLIFVGMVVFIIPKFQTIFGNLGSKLPWLTQTIVSMDQWFNSHIYLFPLFGLVLWAGVRQARQNEKFRYVMDERYLAIPFIGDLILKNETARMTCVLGPMIRAQVPLNDALLVASGVVKNRFLYDDMMNIANEVRGGSALSVAFRRSHFPPELFVYLEQGEATAAIPQNLDLYAEEARKDVEHSASRLSEITQPVLIVVLGVMIGVLVIALYLPMFSYFNSPALNGKGQGT